MQELSGSTPTANLLSGGVDEVFTRTDSAGARNFLTDALGSTVALTDASGTVQTSYTFDPFGNASSSGASSGNSFLYTGRELDGTGLYFYRARYYNPQLQRFISEDPIRSLGGINFYAYVQNDPAGKYDPTGLAASKCGSPKCIPRDLVAPEIRMQLALMNAASALTGVSYYFGFQGSYTGTRSGFGYTIGGSAGFATDPQGNAAIILSGGGGATLGTPGFEGGIQIGSASFQNVHGFGGNSFGKEASGGQGLIVGGGYDTNSSGTFTYANIGAGLGKNIDVSPEAFSNGLKVILICP